MTAAWRALLASTLAYFAVAFALSAAAALCRPGDLDAHGHVVGRTLLLVELAVGSVAAFVAGAVASARARVAWTHVAWCCGGPLFLVLFASTLALWDDGPGWFDVLSLSMFPPFFVLGAAWRGAEVAEAGA